MKTGSSSRGVNPPGEPRITKASGWALVGVVVVANLLGATRLRDQLWGSHAYAFFPWPWLAVALLTLAAGLALGHWRRRPPEGTPAALPAWLVALIAAASSLIFWELREGHTFLGDGEPLTADLPRGQVFHAHEPLTMWLQHVLYEAARQLPAAAHLAPEELARDAVAAGSCLLGALFVWLSYWLAAEVIAAARPDPATDEHEAPALHLLVWALLLCQGYLQLFFGYVENYGFVTSAIAAYLTLLLRALRGRRTLLAASALLALAIALDLSAVVLMPMLLVAIAVVALGVERRRVEGAAALAAFALVLLLAQWGLPLLGAGQHPFLSALVEIARTALEGHGEGGRLGALFTLEHVRDSLSEQLLIGPLAGFGFALALLAVLAGPWRAGAIVYLRAHAAVGVLVVGAAAACVAAFATGDLNLGYARDWDLFAPFGVPIACAALALWLSAGMRSRALASLLAVSAFAVVPWIALNHSFEKSFERVKVLPLGFGRAQVVVGHWYLAHGDPADAKRWFAAALREYPDNAPAHYYLGELAIRDGAFVAAAEQFEAAIRSRPDKANYRLALADARTLNSDVGQGAAALRELVARAPDHAQYWGAYAVTLAGVGDAEGSRAASRRAITLAPGDTLYTSLATTLAAERGFERAFERYWNTLTAR